MSKAVKLTELTVGQLKPKAKRYDVRDSIVPGFGIRVNTNGSRTWFFRNRARGRFTIGAYPAIGLLEARDKARAWATAKEKGVILADAERAEERKRDEERGELFGVVVEWYISRYVSTTRSYEKSAREIRKYLVPDLGEHRLNDITSKQVGEIIRRIAKTAPYQARAALIHVKGFYKWAISNGLGGVKESPVRDIDPRHVIGRNVIKPRDRVLSPRELLAFWRATERLGYPYGDLFRLLYLTGSRKEEWGDAAWSEIDWEGDVPLTLTVPAERYKTGATHVVQLSEWALRIVQSIKAGGAHKDWLFSYGQKNGYGVINSGGNPKADLDALIAEEWAKLRSNAPFAPFKTHDLRRTLETNLAELGIDKEIRDAIAGHARKGVQRTYNHSKLARPIRDALALHEKWLLKQGLTPPPKGNKVVRLRKAA